MSSIKRRKKKKIIEPPKVSMYDTVPENIKMLFGKFYAYSFLYVLFFGILYPFFLMYYLNKIFTVVLFVILIILYGLVVYDILKKREKYKSNMFVLCILFVILNISFSLLRFIV